MQIFYLVRHGETDWNNQGLLQGHTDIALNAEGVRQAQGLSQFLKQSPFDIGRVISSDLQRARATAEIALPEKSIDVDSRFREVFLGKAEGTDRHKMRETFGHKLIDQWLSENPIDFLAHFPEGESRRQGVDRFKEGLHHWLQKTESSAGRLAFFTHGLIMRSFTQEVEGRNHENFRAPNCSIFEFGCTGKKFKLRQIFLTNPSGSIEAPKIT